MGLRGLLSGLLTIGVFGYIKSAGILHVPKDSLRQKSLEFITFYPSLIFAGDISMGAELSCKRIRQEIIVSYKTYQVIPEYKFDHGYRLDYYIKYNLIKNKNHLLSADLGYTYAQRYFVNKVVPFNGSEDMYEGLQPESRPMYKSDRKEWRTGFGWGISNLSRLYKQIFWGMNLDVFMAQLKVKYSAKEHISGPEIVDDPAKSEPIRLPYYQNYTKRRQVYLSCLVKIAYCF